MKCEFINLGGQCHSAGILKTFDRKCVLTFTQSALSNIKLIGGIKRLLDFFNGDFEKKCLCENPQYIIVDNPNKGAADGKSRIVDNKWEFVEIRFEKRKERDDLKKRYLKTKNYISSSQEDHKKFFLYTLNLWDVSYSKEELYKIKNEISKYIDIDRLVLLGTMHGDKFPYNTHNPYFKEVFGGNYIYSKVILDKNENSLKVFKEYLEENKII